MLVFIFVVVGRAQNDLIISPVFPSLGGMCRTHTFSHWQLCLGKAKCKGQDLMHGNKGYDRMVQKSGWLKPSAIQLIEYSTFLGQREYFLCRILASLCCHRDWPCMDRVTLLYGKRYSVFRCIGIKHYSLSKCCQECCGLLSIVAFLDQWPFWVGLKISRATK